MNEKLDGSIEVRLVLARHLDRERRDIHRVTVVAVDGGIPAQTGSLEVSVVVLDANDNPPEFDGGEHFEARVTENAPLLSIVFRLTARDPDLGENGRVGYYLAASTRAAYGSTFAVNNVTGELYIVGVVDYETSPICHLIVVATDHGTESRTAEATVAVAVDDVNDNPPTIIVNTLYDSDTDVAHVTENASPGTFVGHVIVRDPDRGAGGRFNCSVDDSRFRLRRISSASGGEFHIITAGVAPLPDRERRDKFRLTLACEDFGVPTLVTSRRLTVDVLDMNDNAPQFSLPIYTVSVKENNEPGAVLTHLNATDIDINVVIEYRMSNDSSSSSMFAVDPTSGVVTALVSLDREQSSRHKFNVYAIDGGTPAALTATARVIVNVVDVNDEAPVFTRDRAVYSFRVAERLPAGAEVGTVRARDADAPPNNQFQFELIYDDGRSTELFSLNAENGLLTTTRRLDREQCATYRLLVTARDNVDRSLVNTATIVITVDDVNDNSPVFLFPVPRNRTARVTTFDGHVRRGRWLTTVRAIDADEGPNGRVTYAIVTGQGHHLQDENDVLLTRRRDHYFRINATSGDIFADRNFRVTPGSVNDTFRLTLVAVDGGHGSLRTFSELVIVFDNSHAILDPATPPIHRDKLGEASGTGGRLMMWDNNVEAVVAVCVVTGIVAAVLLAAIIFVGCHQRVAAASRRLNKSSPTPTCYRPAAGAAAAEDYGDSPCSKSSAAPLVVGRFGYSDNALRQVEVGDESLLPMSSPGNVIVRLIDRKYSFSGRRDVTSDLLYSPNFGCRL